MTSRAATSIRATSLPARLVRGSLLALVGTALAFGGHAFASTGHPTHLPQSPLVLVIALAAIAACALLSDRVWSLRALFVALMGVQVVVHGGLWLASQEAATSLCSAAATANEFCGAANTGHVAHQGAYALSLTMVGAHLAAAALTAVLLRRGELVFWLIVALFARWLVIAMPTHATPGLKPTAAPSYRSTISGTLVALAQSVSRRGPPSVVTA